MIKRRIYRNCTTGTPEGVQYIERWYIEFPHFTVLIRINYIYEDGHIEKKSML